MTINVHAERLRTMANKLCPPGMLHPRGVEQDAFNLCEAAEALETFQGVADDLKTTIQTLQEMVTAKGEALKAIKAALEDDEDQGLAIFEALRLLGGDA